MRKLFTFFILVGLVFMAVPGHALEKKPDVLHYGISVGGAIGDNIYNRENWVPQFRGHLGLEVASMVYTEFGLHYAGLRGDATRRGFKGYKTNTLIGDWRMVFSPFDMSPVQPFIYAGFGVSKDLQVSDSDLLPVVPFGAGLRFYIAPKLAIDLSGTYDLFISDDLDGYEREGKKNPISGGKHDAFYGFMVGLSVVPERVDWEALELAEKRRMEEEARLAALAADPDGDGLTTGDEQNSYKTDSQDPDTDDDGLLDGAEIRTYSTNPLKADTDSDGLDDGTEVNKFKSNPLLTDTDADGLADGVEVSLYKTDPANNDTDGDGLRDGEEISIYKTDPTMVDTDMGGLNDGAEIERGKDPLNPDDDGIVLETGNELVLHGINFELNSDKLTPNSITILEGVYEALLEFPDAEVIIEGHSDSSGNDEYNLALSQKRANAVMTWLVRKGIDSRRLEAVGKGETEPIADNGTAEGRAQNRRIEFSVK